MGEDLAREGKNRRVPSLSLRFQADADLNLDIVKAVRRREPAIDFASSTDSNLRGIKDPDVLERVAVADRVLVTHDVGTMLQHFRDRLAAGKTSPGLLVVSQAAAIGPVAESILILWSVNDSDDLRDQVYHLPSLAKHQFR